MVETLQLVQREWQRRVVAEYGSAGITHALLGWLMKLGASPTLLHEATRIVDDELVHAEHALAVMLAAGGSNLVSLEGELGLALAPGESVLDAVCAHGTRVFCLGETVAVRLFKRLREGTTVAVARTALDRVLSDEVRHRDFGWLLLEWLSQRPEWPRLAEQIRRGLPLWLEQLKRSYADGAAAPFDEACRAWGMMPNAEYRDAFFETLERDYVPRFAEYGIDARAHFSS